MLRVRQIVFILRPIRFGRFVGTGPPLGHFPNFLQIPQPLTPNFLHPLPLLLHLLLLPPPSLLLFLQHLFQTFPLGIVDRRHEVLTHVLRKLPHFVGLELGLGRVWTFGAGVLEVGWTFVRHPVGVGHGGEPPLSLPHFLLLADDLHELLLVLLDLVVTDGPVQTADVRQFLLAFRQQSALLTRVLLLQLAEQSFLLREPPVLLVLLPGLLLAALHALLDLLDLLQNLLFLLDLLLGQLPFPFLPLPAFLLLLPPAVLLPALLGSPLLLLGLLANLRLLLLDGGEFGGVLRGRGGRLGVLLNDLYGVVERGQFTFEFLLLFFSLLDLAAAQGELIGRQQGGLLAGSHLDLPLRDFGGVLLVEAAQGGVRHGLSVLFGHNNSRPPTAHPPPPARALYQFAALTMASRDRTFMDHSTHAQYYSQLGSFPPQLLRTRDSRDHSASRLQQHNSPPFQRPVSIRNPEVTSDREPLSVKIRELEAKIRDQEMKMQALERRHRSSQLGGTVQELMKRDNQLEEKVASLGQMVSHLMAVKADRKEQVELAPLWDRLTQLTHHTRHLQDELASVSTKFTKLVTKIQSGFSSMGQQYEQFIESNIIKSIEHVNRLTQHYHQQMEDLRKEQTAINSKIQLLSKEKQSVAAQIERKKEEDEKNWEFAGKMMCDGLRIVQIISVKQEKKGLTFGSQLRQQLRGSQSSDSTPKQSQMLTNLYEPISAIPSTATPSEELLLFKKIYKLDDQLNLLDESNNYILDDLNLPIRLHHSHLTLLREHGLL